MIFTLIKFSTRPAVDGSSGGGSKNMNSIPATPEPLRSLTSGTNSDNQGLPSKIITHQDYKVSSKTQADTETGVYNKYEPNRWIETNRNREEHRVIKIILFE